MPDAIDFSSPHYNVRLVRKRGGLLDLTPRVVSLRHTDSGRRSTSLVELEFDNSDDYVLAQPDLMRKGGVVQVKYGYPGLMRNAGEFVTRELEGTSSKIKIRAYERKRSKMARKMQARVWKDTTRSAVVREILLSHGYDDRQLDVEDTAQKYATITQVREDDWAFIQRLADLQGFVLYADEYGVHWHKHVKTTSPSHLWRYVRGAIGVGIIRDYTVDSFGAGIPGRIVLKGRDPIRKVEYTVTGSEDQTKHDPLVMTDDLKTPDEGDREEHGDQGYEIVRNIGMRSEAEAKRLADSIYREYRYSATKLKLEIFGDPTVRTHKVIVVSGIGPAIDGLYKVNNCEHDFSSGYKCSVDCRRDGNKALFGTKSKAFEEKLKAALGSLLKQGLGKIPLGRVFGNATLGDK